MCRTWPVNYLLLKIFPNLYSLEILDDEVATLMHPHSLLMLLFIPIHVEDILGEIECRAKGVKCGNCVRLLTLSITKLVPIC